MFSLYLCRYEGGAFPPEAISLSSWGLLCRKEQVRSSQRHWETNKKATVQKCTVAKKTQKVKTFNGLQAHFEMDAIFDYV